MIEIKQMSKSFKDTTVLKDVNLTIPKGSIFGLIGPNGSGKSTLLRLLTGILKPDQGEITYHGEPVYENPVIKQTIFLVGDEPYYWMNAKIKDLKAFYQVWYPDFDETIYRKYLNVFSLDENKALRSFSKGMKRQAMLVIALAISPQYLFLDEAFDGLDPVMRLTFKRAIFESIQQKAMTVIISSHSLREMEDICDYIGILDQQSVATSGEMEQLKQRIHKLQLAFDKEKVIEDFKGLDIMFIEIHSRVVNIVVRGDIDEIKQHIQTLNPLMMESIEVNLEEVFIYEMDRKGYSIYGNE